MLKILLTENNFSGANCSFKVFFNEIEHTLKNMECEVFRADNVHNAATVCMHQSIDFSLGIGKYDFLLDGRLLCEICGMPHYQWILDNPLKMPHYSTKNFTPVFIDREFAELYDPPPQKFLCLPLGVESSQCHSAQNNRKQGIVFAGQVKNLSMLKHQINRSRQRSLIEKFLGIMSNNLDSSFILQYKEFLVENELIDTEEFFRLTNSYLRCLKRVCILKKIKHRPLILAGEIADEAICQKSNVVLVGKVPYAELPELFSNYTHVLHISPNFSACIHDRILRGLNAGCRVLAEENSILRQSFGDSLTYFNYRDFDEGIFRQEAETKRSSNEILAQFDWKKILTMIIGDYCGRGNLYENQFGIH